MIPTRHVVLVALASIGCATPMTAMREDNRRLSQTVAELRADRRAQDRKIRDLEHQLALAKEKSATTAAVPELPIEVVAPPAYGPGQRYIGVADDGSEIVYEGDAAAGKPALAPSEANARIAPHGRDSSERATERAAERVEARRTPPAPRALRAPVRGDGSPDDDYRVAVELVKAGKHDEAVAALRAFVKGYPRHEYADNAQYWLGEAFYAQKDYQHALLEFRATIETYPRGNKVPDALLKVGYCYLALGQAEKARAVLEQVVNLYPRTEPAALAAKRLESP